MAVVGATAGNERYTSKPDMDVYEQVDDNKKLMTIVIGFHGSRYSTRSAVLPHWRQAFLKLVSYTRFVELMPWSLMTLRCFLHARRGEVTGIQFIDSTAIEVCHPCHAHCHQVLTDLEGAIHFSLS